MSTQQSSDAGVWRTQKSIRVFISFCFSFHSRKISWVGSQRRINATGCSFVTQLKRDKMWKHFWKQHESATPYACFASHRFPSEKKRQQTRCPARFNISTDIIKLNRIINDHVSRLTVSSTRSRFYGPRTKGVSCVKSINFSFIFSLMSLQLTFRQQWMNFC